MDYYSAAETGEQVILGEEDPLLLIPGRSENAQTQTQQRQRPLPTRQPYLEAVLGSLEHPSTLPHHGATYEVLPQLQPPQPQHHYHPQQPHPRRLLAKKVLTTTTTTTTNVPNNQQANKRVVKPSRPRKAVSEFRKKTRSLALGWRGRIGVHVQVDELNIEQICNLIRKKLPDWEVSNYYDCMRVWQVTTTTAPLLTESEYSLYDWAGSEDEDTDKETKIGVQVATHSSRIDFDAVRPEVYLFSFGAAVFWNFDSDESEVQWLRDNILTPFPDACGDDHTLEEKEAAKDDMAFVYGGVENMQFSLKRDVASLETRETGERLAVSFAFAKSALLSMYEERVQKTIDRNSHIPEEMVKNGRLHMTRQDISREIGRMLMVKHGINLDSSLIDTPEEFWDDDRFEATFESSLKYFQVQKRLTVVNNRLNMIGELHSVLAEENTSAHASQLEWIVIILIVVEVLLDLLHLGIY